MSDLDIDDCYDFASDVAKQAGAMIRDAFYKDKVIETKSGITDFVTETDRKVEKMIFSKVRENFPSHSVVGEESVAAGQKCELSDNPTWVVDPIDGTTNFVHKFPYICVSIALMVNKETEVAAIYNPILDHLYLARKGEGALCNGKPLSVTGTTEIEQSLLIAEFGGNKDEHVLETRIATQRALIDRCHGIRATGSAAMNMCLVAAGNVDGYVVGGIHIWDMAAGVLLVREAGGVIRDPRGRHKHDLLARGVLCTGTEALAQHMLPLVVMPQYERDGEYV